MAYDPLSSDVLVDVTIGGTTYIVKAFTDNGEASVETTFTDSDGSWRGRRLTDGERTATMTIERTNAAQAAPAREATCSYRGNDWVIKQISINAASAGPTTFSLTLGWVSATA